ncbi:hypothetical protein MtrunA17_Chr4g0032451 [Medicago truncatula]|uniref:Uncharacterized protein n=1 Tax=Medicago truncatula TaxID=3880 RepID=A0A072UKD9_MEDTR|nr:uncharacterized protein LOC25492571 isoform X2 [Medicago truncatula]KEH30219.1 hypothetical protein MTR_4g065050 [Medicago truncatula]RHN61053.1 hypothetical protein MtrunA17_Chr4g0032451 [Medicago truncatula]
MKSKMSKKKQNDELIAAKLEDDMALQDSLRKVNDLFIITLIENEIRATFLKEEMDALTAKIPEHFAAAFCLKVSKVYMKMSKEVSEFFNIDDLIEEQLERVPVALTIQSIKTNMKLRKFIDELYMDGQVRYAALYVEKSSRLIKDKTEKQDRKP